MPPNCNAIFFHNKHVFLGEISVKFVCSGIFQSREDATRMSRVLDVSGDFTMQLATRLADWSAGSLHAEV